MSRDEIRALQEYFARQGWYTGQIDGLDGPLTQAAVEHYARHFANDLSTERNDEARMAVLNELRQTEQLQQTLVDNGFNIEVDGIKGEETRNAARAAMQARGQSITDDQLATMSIQEITQRVTAQAPVVESEVDQAAAAAREDAAISAILGTVEPAAEPAPVEAAPEAVADVAPEAPAPVQTAPQPDAPTVSEAMVLTPVPSGREGLRQIQSMLNAQGFVGRDDNALAVDGSMGPNTGHAIRTFQERYGLDGTGEINEATWNEIVAQADEATRSDIQEAYLASDTVTRQAQFMLSRTGFDAGPADGVMGGRTREGLNAFREANGLPVSDSIDAATLAVLTREFRAREDFRDAYRAEQFHEAGPVEGQPFVFRYGGRSPAIEAARAALHELNYLSERDATDPAHGANNLNQLDDVMVNALKEFQRDHGLNDDGVLGRNSWAALAGQLERAPSERMYASNPTEYIQPVITHTPQPLLDRMPTQREINELIRLAWDESRGETRPYSQQLVIENVFNRVNDRDGYGHVNDIVSVIYDTKHARQYQGTAGGLPSLSSIPSHFRDRVEREIIEIADGTRPPITGGALWFANPDVIGGRVERWFDSKGRTGDIDNHRFYGGDIAAHREGLQHWYSMQPGRFTPAGEPFQTPSMLVPEPMIAEPNAPSIQRPEYSPVLIPVNAPDEPRIPVDSLHLLDRAAISPDVLDQARRAAPDEPVDVGEDEEQIAQHVPDARDTDDPNKGSALA